MLVSGIANTNTHEQYLFEYFLGLLGQIKVYHWTTMKYSVHKALDELHANLSSNIDDIIESYIGKSNIQPIKNFNIQMSANTNANNLIVFLEEEKINIKNIRNKHFKKCSELQNIIDEMLSSINKTIYLCKLQ